MARLQFIDNGKEENLNQGVEYFAVGLVVECHMVNGAPNRSGRDYAVEYIDPFGVYQYCWRASADIAVRPISDNDYGYLMACYADAKSGANVSEAAQPAEGTQAQPLAYQCRRKTTLESSIWTEWVQCSKVDYFEIIGSPGQNKHGVIREARALGLCSPPGDVDRLNAGLKASQDHAMTMAWNHRHAKQDLQTMTGKHDAAVAKVVKFEALLREVRGTCDPRHIAMIDDALTPKS